MEPVTPRLELAESPVFARMLPATTRADLPAKLDDAVIYLIGPRTTPKWALFTCPCGRGHEISLDLTRRTFPRWRVVDSPRPSIRPSVRLDDAPWCHFLIRDGRVWWVVSWFDETPDER